MHEDPTAIINAVLTLILMRNQSWQLKQADCIGQNNDDKTYKWSFLCWQLSLKSLSEPLTLRWPKHTWRSSSSWSPGLEIKGWHRSCQTMIQMWKAWRWRQLLQSGSDPQESLRLFTQQRDSDKGPRAVCNGSQSLCLWRSSFGLVWHQNLRLEADHRRTLNSFITGADKQWRSARPWRRTQELPSLTCPATGVASITAASVIPVEQTER